MSEVLGTVKGRPVTSDDVDAIVANAEAGFPGVTFTRVARSAMDDHASRMISVRIDPELNDALLTRLAETGTTTADIVRAALRKDLIPA